jgi:hypothetical protein
MYFVLNFGRLVRVSNCPGSAAIYIGPESEHYSNLTFGGRYDYWGNINRILK